MEAKVCDVASLDDIARRFGAIKTTKLLEGVVVNVETTQNSFTRRASTTLVTTDYSLGSSVFKIVAMIRRSNKEKNEELPSLSIISDGAVQTTLMAGARAIATGYESGEHWK
jgi:hypothetical protein